jgi:hypothetical protein
MLARDIAALVPMPRLLDELGFAVNQRSRRCQCVLHTGKNPGSFSWTDDGKWFCFTQCGGGDRIALVMAARRCDFKSALQFLAALAGVNLNESAKFRDELARARRERKRREIEQARLRATERRAFLETRSNILRLERLRQNAGRRLAALLGGIDRERFSGEVDLAWAALAFVADHAPQAAAAYAVIAFSNLETRLQFASHPERRASLIDDCLDAGGVRDEKGHFVSLIL